MTGTRILRVARRGAVILGGHLLSSLSVVPTVVLFGWIVERTGPTPKDILDPEIFGVVVVATALVFFATLVPAGAVIAFAEIKAIRHWVYFVFAGGLTALLLLGLLGLAPRPGNAAMGSILAAFFVGAGFIAGLVYWIIAGRRSGVLAEAWRSGG